MMKRYEVTYRPYSWSNESTERNINIVARTLEKAVEGAKTYIWIQHHSKDSRITNVVERQEIQRVVK